MSPADVALAGWQVRYNQRSFWRNRRAAFFSLAFPVMFLIVFGGLNGSGKVDGRNVSFIDFYTPGIIAYAVILTGFNNTALTVAGLRSNGILKRVRVTPLPWPVFVAGAVGSTLIVIALSSALMLAIGAILFGAHLRVATLPGLLATLVLGSAAFTTLGFAAARLVNKPENGMGVLTLITLPLTFVSNVFFPIDNAPDWLNSVSKAFPLRPLADGMQTAFDPATAGPGFVGHDLLTLALWTVAGSALMLRYMRTLTARA